MSSPHPVLFTALAVATCLLLPLPLRAQTMWAVGDGEKIERDDLNNPLKRGNSVWHGRQVKLFGTRNEIIAFQLKIYTVRDLPAGIYRGRITATFYGPSKAFDECESAWRTL